MFYLNFASKKPNPDFHGGRKTKLIVPHRLVDSVIQMIDAI